MSEPDTPRTVRLMGATGRKVYMAHGTWEQTIPVAELPAQRALYDKLAKRHDAAFARFYDPWVEALDLTIAEATKRGLL